MALWPGLWGVHRVVPRRDETPSSKIHRQGKNEAKAVGTCCLPVCTCCLRCTLLPKCTIYWTGQGWGSSTQSPLLECHHKTRSP